MLVSVILVLVSIRYINVCISVIKLFIQYTLLNMCKNDIRLQLKKNWFNKNASLLDVRRLPAMYYIDLIKYI